jgi:hypothetical protein
MITSEKEGPNERRPAMACSAFASSQGARIQTSRSSELKSRSGEGEQRPVIIERKPDHVLLAGRVTASPS